MSAANAGIANRTKRAMCRRMGHLHRPPCRRVVTEDPSKECPVPNRREQYRDGRLAATYRVEWLTVHGRPNDRR
jgi:hypothetical protein